jgi:hypothetical protein
MPASDLSIPPCAAPTSHHLHVTHALIRSSWCPSMRCEQTPSRRLALPAGVVTEINCVPADVHDPAMDTFDYFGRCASPMTSPLSPACRLIRRSAHSRLLRRTGRHRGFMEVILSYFPLTYFWASQWSELNIGSACIGLVEGWKQMCCTSSARTTERSSLANNPQWHVLCKRST